MNCPRCGTENASAFGYCAGCGKPLQAIEGAVPPPPAPFENKPAGVWWLAATIGTVLLAIFVGVLAAHNNATSDAMATGYVIGTLLPLLGLPFLIAYLVAGRKKARRPRTFAAIFCSISLALSLLNLVGNLNGLAPEPPEQMTARLLREAAGLQPVRSSIFPRRRKMEDALRGKFGKMIQANKDYMAKVNALDISAVKDLNSSKSFVDPAVGNLALQQMHAAYDLDADQEQKMQQILVDLKQALQSTASSEHERQEMEKGFDQGIKEAMTRRSAAIAAEKAWVDSLDDEYAYAREHQASLHDEDGHVMIQGHEIVVEFNRRLDRQEGLRKDFLRLQQDFSKFQGDMMKKNGLKPEDLGRK